MRLAIGVLSVACLGSIAFAQTAEELVAKNIQAKGGLEKIKAVNTVRMQGRIQTRNRTAQIGEERKRPDLVRTTFTMQGMTRIRAYDGSIGWTINPFRGRRDPEMMGEDEVRDMADTADLDGPLVDYQAKGNKVEYLGHDLVEGDDAYKLKVTLKNGDIFYYYLDPDTCLDIRLEKQEFIRGDVRESVSDYGSYKQVSGVYYPFSIDSGAKGETTSARITIDQIEVNVPMDDSQFKMPAK